MPGLGDLRFRPPPTPGPPAAGTSYVDRIRWVPVYNDSIDEAPAGALLRTTASLADGTLVVDQPNVNSQTGLLVGHPFLTIPSGGYGLATADPLAPAAYDDGDTPAVGDEWGAASGSWLLTSGQTGYKVAGDENGRGQVEVVPTGGSGSGGVAVTWVKITGKSGSGASAVYNGTEQKQTAANTWADNGTADAFTNIVRLKSGDPRPDLKTDGNTYVGVVEDPTFAGVYVVVTPGSVYEAEIDIPVEFEITPGSPCLLSVADTKTYTISAPDLLVT